MQTREGSASRAHRIRSKLLNLSQIFKNPLTGEPSQSLRAPPPWFSNSLTQIARSYLCRQYQNRFGIGSRRATAPSPELKSAVFLRHPLHIGCKNLGAIGQ
eukprot:scaffold256_cov261-Pinguiococcus_pyrenoidosus.AAC.40